MLRILKWLALVVITLIIVMFAINWNDQPPSPATAKMRSLLNEGSEVLDEENAFVYAMGFVAPQGDDPVRSGSECIAKINDAVHKQTIKFDTDLSCGNYSSPIRNNSVISKLFDICNTPGKSCEDALKKNEQAIVQWLHDYGWLLERYEGLLNRSKWHSTMEFSLYMPFTDFGALGDGRKMLFLKSWYLAGQGKSVDAQILLNLEVRFWRTVLSSSNTLLDKMVASAFLGRYFTFSNLVLRRLHQKGILLSVPDEWLVPFERKELSLKRVMAGEWAFHRSMFKELKTDHTLLEGDASEERVVIVKWLENIMYYFLLPQATNNASAESLLRLADIFDVPVNRLPQAIKQADGYFNELDSVGNLLHPYNPVGNVLIGLGVPAYKGFAERVYNLEGVRRAALAVAQLRSDGIGVNQVGSALVQSDLRNPYDEKPFVWNAETNSVIFKGLGQEERNTYSFIY